MNAIWCLFSVDNNYDQPDHNLVTWWSTLPGVLDVQLALRAFTGSRDLVALKEAAADLRIRVAQRPGSPDSEVVFNPGPNNTRFRLERLYEGKLPCARK